MLIREEKKLSNGGMVGEVSMSDTYSHLPEPSAGLQDLAPSALQPVKTTEEPERRVVEVSQGRSLHLS